MTPPLAGARWRTCALRSERDDCASDGPIKPVLARTMRAGECRQACGKARGYFRGDPGLRGRRPTGCEEERRGRPVQADQTAAISAIHLSSFWPIDSSVGALTSLRYGSAAATADIPISP